MNDEAYKCAENEPEYTVSPSELAKERLEQFAHRVIHENRANSSNICALIAGIPFQKQADRLRVRIATIVRDAFVALGICPCCEGSGNHPLDTDLVCPVCNGSGTP